MRSKNSADRSPVLWAEVDLGRLEHNLKVIRKALGAGGSQVLAIVKADAYGHGMRPVARSLIRQGVSFFGVANIEEALELRGIAPRANILVLGSFHEDQIPFFVRKKIIPTISSIEDAELFEKHIPKKAASFPVHVKIDTGMGRLGVWHEDATGFFSALRGLKKIEVQGIYTHFSHADHDDRDFTERQIAIFNHAIDAARQLGFKPKYLHAANSMGLTRFKHSHLNLVRPGIILYGIDPRGDAKSLKDLRPVLSLKTRILFLKEIEKGRAVSYSGTYSAPRKTRIAALPVGYSHGYRVGYSNKACVMVRGRKYPVVGRVTMDQTLVDVGVLSPVRRWDEVTLIGEDGRCSITAHDLACLIGSIPYEIVCSIHSRIPRIYKGLRKS